MKINNSPNPSRSWAALLLACVVLFSNVCMSQQKLVRQMVPEPIRESQKVNPETEKAYVHVKSQIPNLRFDSNRKIDKVVQTSSGDWDLWLPGGTHILKISAEGYQTLELPAYNYGKKKSFELKLKVKAIYSIMTDPVGALVRIDDRDTLTSPGKIELDIGTHKVELSKSNYESLMYNITMTEAGFSDEKKLLMLKALYSLRTEPSDANVTIDGQRNEKTPLDILLPLGEHKILISKTNCDDISYRFILDEQGLSDTKILVKRVGVYKLTTNPPAALVSIDGLDAGKTPVDTELALGKHAIEIDLANHDGISYDIDLKENGLSEIKILTPYFNHEAGLGVGFGVPFEKELFKTPHDLKASPDNGMLIRMLYLYNLTSSFAIGGHVDGYVQTINEFEILQGGLIKKASFEFAPWCIGVEGRWTFSRGKIDTYCFIVMDSFSGDLKSTGGEGTSNSLSGFNIGFGLGLKFRMSDHVSGAAECLASFGSATWKNKVADNSRGVDFNSTFAAGYFTFCYEWGGH